MKPERGLSTVFGLLAVTGLRVSEALALDRKDVDLQQGILQIRRTKFGKSRLVMVPSKLSLEELDAPFVGEFLDHLEKERGVAARSRNTRLEAIHSFFQYVSFQEPTRADQCRRVLAIPSKRL